MKRLQGLFYVSLALGVASLTMGLLVSRKLPWVLSLVPLLLGLFWGLAHWRRRWDIRLSRLSFIIMWIFLLGAAWKGLELGWLLLGMIGLIMAWDLARMLKLASGVDRIQDEGHFLQRYFLRLGGLLFLGVGLCFLALNLQFDYSFGWGVILGLVLIAALSRVVSFLRS